MDWRRPFAVVSPGATGAVLDALSSSVVLVTGREVARRAGVSPQGALVVLNRLVAAGLVVRESAPTTAYRLNPEHVAFDAVRALCDLRSEVFRTMAERIAAWDVECASAVVFGSAARGEATDESDVDLLLVRPAHVASDDARWTAQIGALASSVRAWTGNDLAVVEVGSDELDAVDTTLGDVIAEAEREGVPVGGAKLRALRPLRAR